MRVATVDIGTNTVLLLLAETRGGEGARGAELVAFDEQATITRLGQGVDKTRRLAPEAIARTNACLDAYAARVREAKVDRVAVVGTSAMRDAAGGAEVARHVKEAFGIEARVIAGEEEARLTFLGALGGLPEGSEPSSPVVVFDIGGGSTEIVVGEVGVGVARGADGTGRRRAPKPAFATSLDVGSVRLTERHVKSDPPTAAERDAIVRDVQRAMAETSDGKGRTELAALRSHVPVGIAGTVTSLAAIARGLVAYDGAVVHGMRLPVPELRAVVERLASMPLEARRQLPGLEPKRADVIVAGGLVTLTLLEALGAKELLISDRGVRWGLAEDLCSQAT